MVWEVQEYQGGELGMAIFLRYDVYETTEARELYVAYVNKPQPPTPDAKTLLVFQKSCGQRVLTTIAAGTHRRLYITKPRFSAISTLHK